MGESAGYRGQAAGFLQQFMNQDPARYNLDPMAAQRSFLAGAPELQQLARSSVSDYAPDDLVRAERDNILEQLGASFGGSPNSGAFVGAASQALATPLLQRAQQQEQLRAQVMSQLLGQSQGLLNQNFLNQAQGNYQSQMDNRGRFLQAMQGATGLGGQAMQGAGIYGNLTGQALGGIAQLTQPVYSTPDYMYQPSMFEQFLNAGVQGAQIGLGVNAMSGGGGA